MFDPQMLQSFNFQNVLYLVPEMILAFGLLFVLGLTILTAKKTAEENAALMLTSLLFIALSLFGLVATWSFKLVPLVPAQSVMFGAVTSDLFGALLRLMLLLGAGISIAISERYLEKNTRIVGDFYILVMGATLGGMILASATDLITVFVALETLSITSYILVGYFRKTIRSAEASFKYLVYGGMGTAVFLFGLSIVYGLVGSTGFEAITQALLQYQGIEHPTLVVMLLMIFAALAFKLALAPFHMWAPDVYEGAPTPVSAFLSVVSKSAAFAVTIRMLVTLFSGFSQWVILLVILSVLSMTIGNLVALKQRNIKRLLAYSTIAHAGYMLLGLAVMSIAGIGSLVFYLLTYLFMNLGAFACAIYFSILTQSDDIEAYRGLVHRRPGMTLAFSICLLSLAGIPITAGFFGKFFLFQAVAGAGPFFLGLVIYALLNSTVSLVYYLNVIRLMVVKEPSAVVQAIPASSPTPWALSTSLSMAVAITLLLGVFASPFFEFSKASITQLFQQRMTTVSQGAVVPQ